MNPVKSIFAWIAGIGTTGVILIGMVFLLVFGIGACNNWQRGQAVKNTQNKIKIATKNLALYDLQIKQARKQAQVKKEVAIGQKLANEQISRRLTPLFVQYEMIEALKAIAASGKNNSVIYIPSGANGVPLIAPTGQQVYGGSSAPAK
jgi:hypothetical protein